ncbi:MAG: zinc dependent phospholipase C family protein [Spirochaetia bacterium]|nr:zinc dependent phospholipase C family protein [Spirochaetia bacterium]
MPSHIAHTFFGFDIMKRLSVSVKHPQWFILGCQGPDIFLHNQKSFPSGLAWGRQLHHCGYGSFAAHLCSSWEGDSGSYKGESDTWNRIIGSWNGETGIWNGESPVRNRAAEFEYILGFLTHAVLDRMTHPYITYFSGWGKGRRLCHAFFERLLDIEVMKLKEGGHPGETSFVQSMHLTDKEERGVISMLSGALELHFPGEKADIIPVKTKNALQDTFRILEFTDSWAQERVHSMLELERKSGKTRLLALFHPPYIPEGLDVMNSRQREWRHPWDGERRSRSGFAELYKEAEIIGAEMLEGFLDLCAVRDMPEQDKTRRIEEIVGNGSLNSGLPCDAAEKPRFSDPLPIPEALEELYSYVSLQFGD